MMLLASTFVLFTYSFSQNPANNFGLYQFSFGPTIANSGLGISLGAKLKNHANTYIGIDIRDLHHSKEAKVYNPNFTNPRTYVYGKQNSAFLSSASFSLYKNLGEPSDLAPTLKLGISAGPTIAFLKPYYVYIQEFDNNSRAPILGIQNPENTNQQNNILGAAGWNTGLDKLHQNFGFHADVNLLVEWDKKYRLGRLKTGIRFDYFPKDLNILYQNNNQLFTSFFTSYQVGGVTK